MCQKSPERGRLSRLSGWLLPLGIKYVDLERNDHEYFPGRSALTSFRVWAFSIEDLLWDNLLTFADHA